MDVYYCLPPLPLPLLTTKICCCYPISYDPLESWVWREFSAVVFESKGVTSKYSGIRTYGIPWFYRPPKWGKSCQGEGSFAFLPHRARRRAAGNPGLVGISTAGVSPAQTPQVVKEDENGSVSGDGDTSRCCTLEEFSQGCGWASVMAVREKCDEKRQGVRAVGPFSTLTFRTREVAHPILLSDQHLATCVIACPPEM
jgi:hypothetical protein